MTVDISLLFEAISSQKSLCMTRVVKGLHSFIGHPRVYPAFSLFPFQLVLIYRPRWDGLGTTTAS